MKTSIMKKNRMKPMTFFLMIVVWCVFGACGQRSNANNQSAEITENALPETNDADRTASPASIESQDAPSVTTTVAGNTNNPEIVLEPDSENDLEFDVIFRPEFDESIYPCLIFGLTEIEKSQNMDFNYFTIVVETSKKTDLRIVVQESTMNFETVINKKRVAGKEVIVPAIKWKYEELKKLRQPGYVDITFVCYNDDTNREIGRKNLKLRYRAINECVIAAMLGGEPVSLHFMVAAYVNEDSQIVDGFLSEVLRDNPNLSFVGYQAGDNYVLTQVEAIFYTLRKKGIKYSNITSTSNTQNPNIVSQYIRFSDEVLKNTQANCADGTVFLCSVLKKIGIRAVMIFVPGHIYLGYYLNDQKSKFWVLETTLIGSNCTFREASDYQIPSYEANFKKMTDDDPFDGYLYIEIDESRSMIKPIGQ